MNLYAQTLAPETPRLCSTALLVQIRQIRELTQLRANTFRPHTPSREKPRNCPGACTMPRTRTPEQAHDLFFSVRTRAAANPASWKLPEVGQ